MIMDDKCLQKLNIKKFKVDGITCLDTSNAIDEYELFSLPVKYSKFDGSTFLFSPFGDNSYLGLHKDNIVCSFYFGSEFYVYAILKRDRLYKVLLELADMGIVLNGRGECIEVYEKRMN